MEGLFCLLTFFLPKPLDANKYIRIFAAFTDDGKPFRIEQR